MKIAIVGGDGTGKTTLASALGAALSLPVVAPLKHALLEASGFHTLWEWDAATTGFPELVERSATHEAGHPAAIVDGGLFEAYALLQRWAWHRLSPERSEALRDRILVAARTYTHVIVLPPRIVAGFGPGRFCNEPHNRQLGRLITAFATEAGVRSSTLDDGDAAARLSAAIAATRG